MRRQEAGDSRVVRRRRRTAGACEVEEEIIPLYGSACRRAASAMSPLDAVVPAMRLQSHVMNHDVNRVHYGCYTFITTIPRSQERRVMLTETAESAMPVTRIIHNVTERVCCRGMRAGAAIQDARVIISAL